MLPARRLRARSAGAAANAAPAAAACARRSLSGRRRSAPLACPALLAFFPLPEGGASRAEPGAGRRGEEEEEAEDGEKEEEREASCFPPPGCRRSPISRSLKLDPESGARDCITDYIRLIELPDHTLEGSASGGRGVGEGREMGGGRIKCIQARKPRRAQLLPHAAGKPRVGSLLSVSSRNRGAAVHWLVGGWLGGWMDRGQMDGRKEVIGCCM